MGPELTLRKQQTLTKRHHPLNTQTLQSGTPTGHAPVELESPLVQKLLPAHLALVAELTPPAAIPQQSVLRGLDRRQGLCDPG